MTIMKNTSTSQPVVLLKSRFARTEIVFLYNLCLLNSFINKNIRKKMEVYQDSEGRYHRVDGPAVIWPSGQQEWWVNGKRHRENDPAYIGADGSQEW